jgi:cell division protein FtsQ
VTNPSISRRSFLAAGMAGVAVAASQPLFAASGGARKRIALLATEIRLYSHAQHFVDLPLVVGEGANTAASAILPLVQARPSLMSRIWALVRVDNRRWDLRLKDQSLIQLPAEGEDGALMHLDQLERDQQVLSLGFSRIDLTTQDVRIRPREGLAGPLAAPLASPTPVAG